MFYLKWCRRKDLNPQQTHYKCVALPFELLRHASAPYYWNQLLAEVCIALGTVFMLLQVCVSGLPALPEGATNINYNAPLCTSIIILYNTVNSDGEREYTLENKEDFLQEYGVGC